MTRCSFHFLNLEGKLDDGAANMSGVRSGVHALMKKEESQALCVHGLAHILSLTLKYMTKSCDLLKYVMNFIYNLVQLIKLPPKRSAFLRSFRKRLEKQTILEKFVFIYMGCLAFLHFEIL